MYKFLFISILMLAVGKLLAQPYISDFVSVAPTAQTQQFVLPNTHTFQVLAQQSMVLSDGTLLPTSPDFTGFVPINGSSTNGYLSLNHEKTPGNLTIFDIAYDTLTELWDVNHSQTVDMTNVHHTSHNCSGGLTPWGTVLSGEETIDAGDANGDGYEDVGWLLEVNPVTRTAIRKLWAVGRFKHENAAILANGTALYTGADDQNYGYLYKFVPDVANDMTAGKLFVLQLTSNGQGNWLQVPNTTQSERNNTGSLAKDLGATNISGIEDVEIGPDGKIYLAAKYSGQVYRFDDMGTTVEHYETYIATTSYTITHTHGTTSVAWGSGNDNLAFDPQGNLWIMQDGLQATDNNYIWMAHADHSMSNPHIEIFATTPAECEPTGITFTPDGKFIFLSLQHPSAGNTAIQLDAAGKSIIFNRGTTLVIARKEYLNSPYPDIRMAQIDIAKTKEGIILHWQTESETNLTSYTIEKSLDSNAFIPLDTVAAHNQAWSYQYLDKHPSDNQVNYYRVAIRNQQGFVQYTPILSRYWNAKEKIAYFYPNPISKSDFVNVQFYAEQPIATDIRFDFMNLAGVILHSATFSGVQAGVYHFMMPLYPLSAGVYWVRASWEGGSFGQLLHLY